MPMIMGQLLHGRYLIQSLLGQGGMGSVYQALDQTLNRVVAIKERIPDPSAPAQGVAQARAQFRREAQVLATLSHPNLPHVYDYFSEGANEYVVMELIRGESLQQIVDQHGAIREGAVLAWADQILDALTYIHSLNIIHRDIKPANIILKDNGRVVLVDFGLVKLFDPNNPGTQTGMRGMGTAEYAPLEQFSPGMHTDARSDLYSFGATLYHLLAGRPPLDVPHRLIDPTQQPTLRTLNPSINPHVETAIARAMEVQPSARFQSAGAMKQALRPAAGPTAKPIATTTVRTNNSSYQSAVPTHKSVIPAQLDVRTVGFIASIVVLCAVIALGASLGGGLGRVNSATIPNPTATPRVDVVRSTVTLAPITPTATDTRLPPPPAFSPLPPSPLPTQTDDSTPGPTSVPIPPTPTETRIPPTSTNTPPPTPTACANGVTGEFQAIYQRNRPSLNCAIDPGFTAASDVEELFEQGHMFWIKDTDDVFVVYDSAQRWFLYDCPNGRNGCLSEPLGCPIPRSGVQEPVRGFGWVWQRVLGGCNANIGWALNSERAFENLAHIQTFAGGRIFQDSDGVAHGLAYLLFNDGKMTRASIR